MLIPREQWIADADDFRRRAECLTAGVRERNQQGHKHPVEDFLWNYYSLRPSQFEKWHPGFGVTLEDAPEYADVKGYLFREASVNPQFIKDRRTSLEWIAELLDQTMQRPARFNCFGLHEWAMVYQLSQDEVRHEQAPLRLTPKEIAEVVEAQELKCTHYDAFRFYVPKARSLNHMVLEREDQLQLEQSGCLHANMDLYKWCYKSRPIISSELMLRCFLLAREIRTLDMRAAPYDLSAWGLAPVKIETTEGRAEYVQHQKQFAERSQILRVELRDSLRSALSA